jgi:hypothetical protein
VVELDGQSGFGDVDGDGLPAMDRPSATCWPQTMPVVEARRWTVTGSVAARGGGLLGGRRAGAGSCPVGSGWGGCRAAGVEVQVARGAQDKSQESVS